MSKHSNIKQYTAADIERYINRQMSAVEMHALEKAALDDPFLADAIEGYGAMKPSKEKLAVDLEELQGRLRERINRKGKLVSMNRSAWKWGAAAMLILTATGTLLYTLITVSDSRKQTIAKNESVITGGQSNDSIDASPSASGDMQADSESTALLNTYTPPTIPKDNTELKQPRNKQSFEKVPKTDASSARPLLDSLEAKNEETNRVARRNYPSTARKESDSANDSIPDAMQKSLSYHFTGKVVDNANKPVPGALVVIQNKERGISTDSNGNFTFSLPEPSATVLVTSAGFETANASLLPTQSYNRIMLQQDSQALNESMAAPKKKAVYSQNTPVKSGDAEPVTGWTNFQQYINYNKKIPSSEQVAHGVVVLSFTVSENGEPANVSVEKSLSRFLDQEAIRLVKQGPAWKPGNKPGKVFASIRF